MMFGNGANQIFFNKKRLNVQNTRYALTPPHSPPTPIKVDVLFISPLKTEPRLCEGWNPDSANTAPGVSEISHGENLWQWSRLEIRLQACRWSSIQQKQFINIILIHLQINRQSNFVVRLVNSSGKFRTIEWMNEWIAE